MAKTYTSTPKLFFQGNLLSGWLTNFDIAEGRTELPMPACNLDGVARMAGMKHFEMTFNGWADEDDTLPGIDYTLDANLGTDARILTFCPLTGAVGEPGRFSRACSLKYTMGQPLDGVATIAGAVYSRGDLLYRGTVMAAGAKNTTGTGTITLLGAVGASKSLRGALQVYGVSGTNTPTITVAVKSAAAVGFSGPTTRYTFSAATAIGAQWMTPVAGAISDTYWRVDWTVSGTNPSLSINCVLAIE